MGDTRGLDYSSYGVSQITRVKLQPPCSVCSAKPACDNPMVEMERPDRIAVAVVRRFRKFGMIYRGDRLNQGISVWVYEGTPGTSQSSVPNWNKDYSRSLYLFGV